MLHTVEGVRKMVLVWSYSYEVSSRLPPLYVAACWNDTDREQFNLKLILMLSSYVCCRCGYYIPINSITTTAAVVRVSVTTTAIKAYVRKEQISPYKTFANIWRMDIRDVVSICCSGANTKITFMIYYGQTLQKNATCGLCLFIGSSIYWFWLNVEREHLIWAFALFKQILP